MDEKHEPVAARLYLFEARLDALEDLVVNGIPTAHLSPPQPARGHGGLALVDGDGTASPDPHADSPWGPTTDEDRAVKTACEQATLPEALAMIATWSQAHPVPEPPQFRFRHLFGRVIAEEPWMAAPRDVVAELTDELRKAAATLSNLNHLPKNDPARAEARGVVTGLQRALRRAEEAGN